MRCDAYLNYFNIGDFGWLGAGLVICCPFPAERPSSFKLIDQAHQISLCFVTWDDKFYFSFCGYTKAHQLILLDWIIVDAPYTLVTVKTKYTLVNFEVEVASDLMALVLSGKNTSVPPSQEEDDLLMRSSKKIKNGIMGGGENVLEGYWPELGSKENIAGAHRLSFVDKLKGVDRTSELSENEKDIEEGGESDDNMSEDTPHARDQENMEPLCETTEDPARNFPTFNFSGKMKKRLYRAWRKAVIVKLLDRSIGYKALHSRLQFLWAKRGVINLINIGHGFFVVKFTNREDYLNALTGGPWMIYDHYLTVRPWEPKFRSETATIDKVAVWVRMPKVSLEYYDEEALTIIGNRIGETLKVDMNTSNHLRGHYARVCVLVDLSKQLMPGFKLDGEEYYVEYEGLHMLCANCGIYGHRFDSCPSRINPVEQGEREGQEMSDDQRQGRKGSKDSGEYQDQWRVVQKTRRQ